ncbi:MAG: DNA-binding response regulator [Saprospirales bacterium]|nr:MAG: DNA-binding response regulator [Saprospirales bacterium]
MKTIIVDDEPLALDVLETYIQQIPDLELVARCNNALEANEFLSKNEVDLMFLDIEMPKLGGLEFLKILNKRPFVIITTAYPNYAVEGFELSVLDYMLKPISLDRFMKSVNKVREKMELKQGRVEPPSRHESQTGNSSEDYIFVKSDKKFVRIHYSDILYIEGLKDYVIIRTRDGRVIALQTMKSLETKLPDEIFIRVHRSYIININFIDAVVGNTVEMTEDGKLKMIPVGKNYKDDLVKIIEDRRL